MRALILQHDPKAPAGRLGRWCADRCSITEIFDAGSAAEWPDVHEADIVFCLGSRFDPTTDPDEPAVIRRLAFLREDRRRLVSRERPKRLPYCAPPATASA